MSLLVDTTYQKIFLDLNNAGYDTIYDGSYEESVKENEQYIEYIQNYIIKSFHKGNQNYKLNNLMYLDVKLSIPKDGSTYKISAHIPKIDFNWEGDDSSLYLLRDVLIEDIIDALNLKFNKDNSYESIVKKYTNKIYEGLLNQIKEDINDEKEVSLDELSEKINIIMGALGLKTEDEKEEIETEIDTDIFKADNDGDDNEEIMFTDVNVDDNLEETEGDNE